MHLLRSSGVLCLTRCVPSTQVEEIAKIKLPDLNTNKIESAMRTVEGTARNMGIKVKEE